MKDDVYKAQQVSIARAVAHIAHRDQVDKAGMPYIGHPARVARQVRHLGWQFEACAWLHDVVEDSDLTLDDLYAVGVDFEVAKAVDLLTRTDKDVDAYYNRILSDPIARQVKIADVADNSNPARLALLDPSTADRLSKKYVKALRVLEGWA